MKTLAILCVVLAFAAARRLNLCSYQGEYQHYDLAGDYWDFVDQTGVYWEVGLCNHEGTDCGEGVAVCKTLRDDTNTTAVATGLVQLVDAGRLRKMEWVELEGGLELTIGDGAPCGNQTLKTTVTLLCSERTEGELEVNVTYDGCYASFTLPYCGEATDQNWPDPEAQISSVALFVVMLGVALVGVACVCCCAHECRRRRNKALAAQYIPLTAQVVPHGTSVPMAYYPHFQPQYAQFQPQAPYFGYAPVAVPVAQPVSSTAAASSAAAAQIAADERLAVQLQAQINAE